MNLGKSLNNEFRCDLRVPVCTSLTDVLRTFLWWFLGDSLTVSLYWSLREYLGSSLRRLP